MSSTGAASPNWRRPLTTALAYAAAISIAAVTLVPLLFVFIGGFRTTPQINASPTGLPHPWVLDNYRAIVTSSLFWRFIVNSAVIAFLATAITVVFGAMAAFGLSRYAFRGREAIYAFFTIGLLFPLSVASLPLYLWLRDLGLLESRFGVILPEAAFSLSITIVILRPFMRDIPGELEDAALVDGSTRLGFFWRILLPLSLPAISTVAILAFVTSWNFFLLPLLVFNNQDHFTLPLGVAAFQTQYSQDTARVLAFSALSVLPTLVFFLAAERRIVGALGGAVKG
ncbi:MAG: raffinose/stachyose/melibiose transport system permease protein [Nocardioidaceae bacterium]|jgi:raffinose/stachyose/melibiose transport system permease protein|nr:raffinose/stachyose/melibiose transport system permease protein [Nocardioidaceae bacterium]